MRHHVLPAETPSDPEAVVPGDEEIRVSGGVRHHVLPAETPSSPEAVVPGDEGIRVSGE